MKSLLKLLCIYLCCAYAFAGEEADKVARAFKSMLGNGGKELILNNVDLSEGSEAVSCFASFLSQLGEETCIELKQCSIDIKFFQHFTEKYKLLVLEKCRLGTGVLGTCLILLEKKVFSELHIDLVDYNIDLGENVFLVDALERNMGLKILRLPKNYCTPTIKRTLTAEDRKPKAQDDCLRMPARLPSAESREVSVVPEMEKSLESARKKRRVAKLDEAMDEDSEVSKFCRQDVRREKQDSILDELKELGEQGKTIDKLSLRQCRIREDFIKRLLALPVLQKLRVLKLNLNPIGDAGAICIAQWLEGNDTVEELHLKGYGAGQFCTGKNGARRILEAMEKSKLRFIDMRGNDFPGSETCIWNEGSGISRSEFAKKQLEALGVAEVDEAMDEDSEVSKFCRCGVRREKRDSILDELKELGEQGKTIDKLSLKQCRIEKGFIKKLLVLPVLRTVKELWLNGNPIGNNGAKRIARWLEGNDTVEELHLRGYGADRFCTGKDGARCILEAIRENGAPNLKFIDMRCNDFPGSETCIWDESSGISRSEFAKKQLEALGVAEVDEAMDEDEENPEDKALANIDDAYKNLVMTSKERLFEDEEMPPFHFNGLQGDFPESENDSYELVPLPFYPWEEF